MESCFLWQPTVYIWCNNAMISSPQLWWPCAHCGLILSFLASTYFYLLKAETHHCCSALSLALCNTLMSGKSPLTSLIDFTYRTAANCSCTLRWLKTPRLRCCILPICCQQSHHTDQILPCRNATEPPRSLLSCSHLLWWIFLRCKR